jgi:hypothetical protein
VPSKPAPKISKITPKLSPVPPAAQPISAHATPLVQQPAIVQQPPLAQNSPFQQPQQEGQLSKLWKTLGMLPDKAFTYFAGNGTPATAQPGSNPQAFQTQHVTGQQVGQNTYTPLSVQQPFKPISNQPVQSQSNQFLQPPGSFPQQSSPLPYSASQNMYYPPGNGPNMAQPLSYYGYQQSPMQAPTTSFYNPGFNSLFSSLSYPLQASPYKKMVKTYKRKDKTGIFPAGVDLSDSDADYQEYAKKDYENGQGSYFVAVIIGVIAIALFLLTRSSGNPVATTVTSAERNIANVAQNFIENSIPSSPSVQQASNVLPRSPAITPTTGVFEQLVSTLRTIIFITIAGVALYCYYISKVQGNMPGIFQGMFASPKKNSQNTNQPIPKKERPGPLLPQLNWWEMFQPAAYPPSRWGNFGSALGGGLGGVVQGYMGLGQAITGQPFYNMGNSYSTMVNRTMPVQMNMHYDADDDEEYDSEDEDEEMSELRYQEYLPAGTFDPRYEPNFFLNEEAKAKAREKAKAAKSAKEAESADATEKKVVYSKSDLPEEFKPYYEPMPPVPGIDDPDPPISDTLVKNGPDKEKLQEVTERKKNGENKGILKKDSDKERIKGLKEGKQEYFMDEYSCKPYGPPPKRYHGVSSGETSKTKTVAI